MLSVVKFGIILKYSLLDLEDFKNLRNKLSNFIHNVITSTNISESWGNYTEVIHVFGRLCQTPYEKSTHDASATGGSKKKKNLEKYQPSTLQSIPLSPTIRLPVLYELIKLFWKTESNWQVYILVLVLILKEVYIV